MRELHIRNLAIIEDVSLEFESGFVILTGETGAGKSILVDGLSLALGERADRDLVRAGADEARVEALFDVERLPEVRQLLVNLELPLMGNELVLRRIVAAGGKSRCAVNGSPVPLSELKQVGDLLADLHGQHDHQLLLESSSHLQFVDAFGGLLDAREGVRHAFTLWKERRDELAAARAGLRGRSERLDLLQFQVDELDSAKLEAPEEARLAAEKLRLANVQKLADALGRAHEALMSDGGAGEMLGAALHAVRGVVEYDRGHLDPEVTALEQLVEQVRDEGNSLRAIQEKLEADPGRLEKVEERLDLIGRLARKYGGTVERALAHLAAAREEAATLASSDEAVAGLEAAVEALRADLSTRAVDLSEERSRAAARFAELVARELKELAMGGADFGIKMSQQDDPEGPVIQDGDHLRTTPEGIDALEFYLAPNVGEGTKPLKAIASGGELSRIMLALKSVLAGVDRVGTLVFDEIDAGIGGRVAEVIWRKLREIGAERQVLCITHLPQIAAKATEHFVIRKTVAGGHTKVEVRRAEGKTRVSEVARMLAGEAITASALEHAATLLKEG